MEYLPLVLVIIVFAIPLAVSMLCMVGLFIYLLSGDLIAKKITISKRKNIN